MQTVRSKLLVGNGCENGDFDENCDCITDAFKYGTSDIKVKK